MNGSVRATLLEKQAQMNARGDETGRARYGDYAVHWYPVSKRFTWFFHDEPCTKHDAINNLGSTRRQGASR